MRLTDGRGVQCVVEVGGAGTIGRSFRAVGQGGKVPLEQTQAAYAHQTSGNFMGKIVITP